ncbi:MAG: MATE family efflux transporter [Campylobacteraceae bacterium]|nr:MATE family efflux transporter [Campylobacteraceae bacterium]
MEKKVTVKNLFFPIYIGMLLSLLTLMINTYMISLVEPQLVGAMGAGNQIFSLVVTIFSFLAVGCSVVVAQAIGAKNNKLAIKAVHASISFNALLGFIVGFLTFIFADEMLSLMQIPAEVFDDSVGYLKIISIVFFIDAVAIVLGAVIRAYGYASHTLLVAVFMNVFTVIGNYIALFEPFGLPFFGLNGVATSTALGRVFGVFILFFILVKFVKMPIYLNLFFKIRIYIMKKILSIGLPSAGENLVWMVQYIIAFSFVASMGASSLTVQTIFFQIAAFIFFASSAIGMANEIIVARLVGSNELEKAYHESFKNLKTGFMVTTCFLVVVYLNKEFIMDLFHLNDELKSIMRPLFPLSFALELARTQNVIMVNALRASGDAKFPFYMGLIFMLGVSLPVGYTLGIVLEMGILGVWIGFFADESLRGIANTLRWKSRKWQDKKVV